MNVMLISVSQRTAEIGLLKALGAAPRTILSLFLTEAVVLSLLGASLGVAVGELTSWLLASLYPALPTQPPGWAIAAGLAVALVTGTLFGILPARSAARLDAVQALARR
jgi:putative ABC transport system permease protein